MDLKDKVVLITGSSIGIGRETAYKFASGGARVIVTYYKDKIEAQKVGEKCQELGASEVLVLHLNVMDDQSIKDVVSEVVKKFGGIDILINNAGFLVWKNFIDYDFSDIEAETRTNLEGLIKMTRESLPHIKEMIINISSVLGFSGGVNATVYSATKWGVRGFTKSIALELGDIKVYCVNPDGTATVMNDFLGISPEDVGEIILKLAKGEIKVESGDDVNINDYLK